MDDSNRDRGLQDFQIESSSANLLNDESQDARQRSESTLAMTQEPTCSTPDPPTPVGTSADKLYDFVAVGARGFGALARPWPAASVGIPTYIDFNISKAVFELKIKVTTNNRPWGGKTPIRSSLSDLGEDEEELSTEIYIPLVHYAADSAFGGESLVNCGDGTMSPKGHTEEPLRYRDDDDATVVAHVRQDSKSSADSSAPIKRRRATTTTLRRTRADTTNTLIPILPIPSSEPTATSPTMLLIPLAAQSIMGTLVEPEMLALEVEVSESKWEFDGQVLWWYDVPGEGE